MNAQITDARSAAVDRMTGRMPVVVVGGINYSPENNGNATLTVRELARGPRQVLNVHSPSHGSLIRRLQGRARHLGARDVARIAFGTTRAQRVEEHLWLAPVQGLSAISPLDVPEAMRRRNVRIFARVIREWLAEIGESECLLLFYWWALPELVDLVPCVASVYDCTDDHRSAPGAFKRASVGRLEDRLLDQVDRSYVVSPGLLDARAGAGRRITVLPTGFDLALFRQLETEGFDTPEVLHGLPHPIIGYAGAINGRMDWDLLRALADRRPEWSFVFVGGEPRAAPASLRDRGNVIFLRSMPYADALRVISCFDVGMIPVRVSRFSRGNSFLKLLDYFAHGLPVVATPVADTIGVLDTGDDLLYLASDVDGWLAALDQALEEPPTAGLRAQRRLYVEARSARRRVDTIVSQALAR